MTESATYELDRALVALTEAARRLQLAGHALQDPYRNAAIIALADAEYARNRVAKIVKMVSAGRAK